MPFSENVISALVVGFSGVIVSWVLRYAWKAMQAPAKIDEDGRLALLEYALIYKLVAWLPLAFAIFLLLISLFFAPPQNKSDLMINFILTGGFLLVGSLPLIESDRKVILSQEGIFSHSLWTKDIFIRWEEVVNVTYSENKGRFVIKSRQAEIFIHKQLSGLSTLVNVFHQMLPPLKYHQAVHEYWQIPATKPANEALSLLNDPLTFELQGWTSYEDQHYRQGWMNTLNDQLILHLVDEPPKLPAVLSDVDGLRAFFQQTLMAEKATLVSLDTSTIAGIPCVKIVAKYPKKLGAPVFTGSLLFPFHDFSYLVRVTCHTAYVSKYHPNILIDGVLEKSELPLDEVPFPEDPLKRVCYFLDNLEATIQLSSVVKEQRPFTVPPQ